MEDLIDLRITLTPPPVGAPPDSIAGFNLDCYSLGLSSKSNLLMDPLTAKERESIKWYLEEYWKWPYEAFLERGKKVEKLLSVVGERLYNMIFGSDEESHIMQAWRQQIANNYQISILSDLPQVISLPWELLHDGESFLALRRRPHISIVRSFPQVDEQPRSIFFTPPLRILVITSRPIGTGFINPRIVASELLDAMQDQIQAGAVEVEFLRPPTLVALRARLKEAERPIHLLHFDGFGSPEGEDGYQRAKFAFESDNGYLDLVDAEVLGRVLQDSGVSVALLPLENSTEISSKNTFDIPAEQLIKSGLDAVIALGANMLVVSIQRYVEAFYKALAEGLAVPIAQEQARRALYDDPRRHLYRRKLDEEARPVMLSDWWVPHLYQKRMVVFQPTKQRQKRKRVEILSNFPAAPLYGFSGRARELFQIERWLTQEKLVVIYGSGGVGKTALACETANWLTRTGMYAQASFISFEFGGDVTTLLSYIGHSLGIYDHKYNPSNRNEALARLAPVLKKRRILFVVDSLESLLPDGEALIPVEERIVLWETLLELAHLKAGVVLVGRNPDVGDGRLRQVRGVAHLTLKGLDPEDAYLFAISILGHLGIDHSLVRYAELRDLLAKLDYHPLAIQLLLPMLRTQPLAKIQNEIVEVLPEAASDTEHGRSPSLLASLSYTLQHLSSDQQALLPSLAHFEGGALEENLLAITGIHKDTWTNLKLSLEQAGLLTTEQVHQDIDTPFIRFHPVLGPYLRSQPGADNPILRLRYAERYYGLVLNLDEIDIKHPQAVQAIVQLELPNLRHSLDVFLEMGEKEFAIRLADSITKFLRRSGYTKQLNDLRQRIAEAISSQEGETLTKIEYLHQSGLGEDEVSSGNLQAALVRFMNLLKRIEIQPPGAPLGRGSYEHAVSLAWVARCLNDNRQDVEAEVKLREALTIIENLLEKEIENRNQVERFHLVLLTDLATILVDRGKYVEGRQIIEESLRRAQEQEDIRSQGLILAWLGSLMLETGEYGQAQTYLRKAHQIIQSLSEPAMEARIYRELGRVAQVQNDWDEAEACYRESLVIEERLGNAAGAAESYNRLGEIAKKTGRTTEAEAWFKRSLEFDEQIQPGSIRHAIHLKNLAALLLDEVQMGQAPLTRLAEAETYAAQASNNTIANLGEFHILTAECLTILGLLLQAQGKLKDAHPIFEKSLAIYQEILGPDNPETITGLANLGLLQHGLGNFQAAHLTLEKAFAIRTQVLGENHPETLISLNDLAVLLQEMGETKSAHYCFGQIESGLEKRLTANAELQTKTEKLLERLRFVILNIETAWSDKSQRARTVALSLALSTLSEIPPHILDLPEPERSLLRRITDRWLDLLNRETERAAKVAILDHVRSPYVYTVPIDSAVMIGREDIFDLITSVWARAGQRDSLLIHGHRRMGKTSVAQAITKRCNLGADTYLIYISLEGRPLHREGDLYKLIAYRLCELFMQQVAEPRGVSGKNASMQFERFLFRVSKIAGNTRIVIVIDEFELLYKRLGAGLADQILDFLRGQTQTHHWLALALVGLSDLEDLQLSYNSSVFGWRSIPVSFLDPSQVEILLVNPPNDPNFPLSYSDEALDTVYHQTHGQPFLVQAIGDELVQRYNRIVFTKHQSHSDVFDRRDVWSVIGDPHFYATAAAYFEGVWSQVMRGQQGEAEVLQALASNKDGMDKSALLISTGLDQEIFERAVKSLCRHEVVCYKETKIEYTVLLMQRWVEDRQLKVASSNLQKGRGSKE